MRGIPSYSLYGEAYEGRFPDCLHCERISDRSRHHEWHIRPHRHHGLHQFLWVAEGGVAVSADDYKETLKAPVAIMNAPDVVHGFEFEPATEGCVVTIPTVNLERGLPGPAALLRRLDRPIVLSRDVIADSQAEVQSRFAVLEQEYHGTQEGRFEALVCYVGLLAVWFLRHIDVRARGGQASKPQAELVRRFLALVEEGFRETRPLTSYARTLGITTTHLSRLCRRHLGRSALAVVHERRVLEAKRSLAYTPATIAHIAEELGFIDPGYFTKFFVQHVGETPSAFRKAFLD